GVLGLYAAAVEDANGLRDLLRRELGEQAAQISRDLGRLGRGSVDAGADRPHGLIGEHRLGDLVGADAGEAGAQLALDGREGPSLAPLLGGLADTEHARETPDQ